MKHDQLDKCEMCGGEYVFDPDMQCMKCNFCGNVKKLETTTKHIEGFEITDMGKFNHNWDTERKSIICQNCGGKTTLGANDFIGYCIYCGSAHIITKKEDDMGMRPKSIVPFNISDEEVLKLFEQWGQEKKALGFGGLPKSYFKKKKHPEFKAIFLPYWSYEMEAHVTWHLTQSSPYSDGRNNTEDHYHRTGAFTLDVVDHLIPAFKNKYLAYIQDVKKFDLTELRDYKGDYLAGFFAQKYTVEPNDGLLTAVEEIDKRVKKRVMKLCIGAEDHWHFLNYDKLKFNLYLLPFYLASVWHGKDLYFVVMNGQNGHLSGGEASKRFEKERPVLDYFKKHWI